MRLQSSVNQVLSVAAMLGNRKKVETERADRVERAKQREEISAQKALKKEQDRKIKTRRSFTDYFNVADTPYGKELQKTITKQFTKSQRQTIMNKIDKERKAAK